MEDNSNFFVSTADDCLTDFQDEEMEESTSTIESTTVTRTLISPRWHRLFQPIAHHDHVSKNSLIVGGRVFLGLNITRKALPCVASRI